MRGFKFSLEPVLKQRKMEEDNRKKELAHINSKIEYTQKIIKDLQASKKAHQDTITSGNGKRIDIAEIQLTYAYIEKIGHDITIQTSMLERLRQELVRKQNALLEAVRERKKFDKLKEKEYKSFMLEVKRIEQKTIDETSIIRFIHGQKTQY